MILPPRKKKHLGQHFLHDQQILQKIVKLIDPHPAEHLIEIGPGAGALTSKILPQVDHLEVIELDQEIIPVLEKNCGYSSKLTVHLADVLQVDFTQFQSPQRLFGNLPYNISTPLLFHLIKNIQLIQEMHFMLQQEVAARITAPPGSKIYGRLSVMIQYYCQVATLLKIGSGAFSPPPKVASAFVRFTPHQHYSIKALDEKKLSDLVRNAFSQRRKIIANSLKNEVPIALLEKIGIDPGLRPEQLAVNEFVTISNALSTANYNQK